MQSKNIVFSLILILGVTVTQISFCPVESVAQVAVQAIDYKKLALAIRDAEATSGPEVWIKQATEGLKQTTDGLQKVAREIAILPHPSSVLLIGLSIGSCYLAFPLLRSGISDLSEAAKQGEQEKKKSQKSGKIKISAALLTLGLTAASIYAFGK